MSFSFNQDNTTKIDLIKDRYPEKKALILPLLWLAQKHIPIGTAYAIWTGIGAAGTFAVGVMFFGDPTSLARYAGVALILGGVITLKLAH